MHFINSEKEEPVTWGNNIKLKLPIPEETKFNVGIMETEHSIYKVFYYYHKEVGHLVEKQDFALLWILPSIFFFFR